MRHLVSLFAAGAVVLVVTVAQGAQPAMQPKPKTPRASLLVVPPNAKPGHDVPHNPTPEQAA